MTNDELALRPALEDDGEVVAAIHLSSRRAAPMPAPVHTDAAVRSWLSGRLQADEVWLAELAGRPVGYLRLSAGWLDDLYVVPDAARQGVGSALLEVAKARLPDGFGLWVFEGNQPARAFYAQHGLLELEHTDGSGNEEREPDVRMVWPGDAPVAYLRSLIDEVDDEMAGLLARRVALTAAVQRQKAVPGQAGRDADREREIAERMAARVPALGRDRVQRIMHTVIVESLESGGG